MHEPGKSKSLAVKARDYDKLRSAWKSTESAESDFEPKIGPRFELEYYVGHAFFDLEMRMGILKNFLAPTISPRELAEHFTASLGWAERDLTVIKEILRLTVKFTETE